MHIYNKHIHGTMHTDKKHTECMCIIYAYAYMECMCIIYAYMQHTHTWTVICIYATYTYMKCMCIIYAYTYMECMCIIYAYMQHTHSWNLLQGEAHAPKLARRTPTERARTWLHCRQLEVSIAALLRASKTYTANVLFVLLFILLLLLLLCICEVSSI
jgi:hypothetical protein